MPEINFDYKPSEIELENNGHSVEWHYDPGSSIDIGETQYDLVQLHFHAPSEHEVTGEHFPMELHVVHEMANGKVAVLRAQRTPTTQSCGQAAPLALGASSLAALVQSKVVSLS